VVIFYLKEYLYLLCRLDSGGETNPKATFLATTLGPRRLFYLLGAIFNPNLIFSFLKKILFEHEKIFLNSITYSEDKNLIFGESNFDVESVYFFCGKSLNNCGFFSNGRTEGGDRYGIVREECLKNLLVAIN
jgi:hypothetical protein